MHDKHMWEEYQQVVWEEFLDWEERMRDDEKKERVKLKILWKTKVIMASDRSIGWKKITEKSRGSWWTDEGQVESLFWTDFKAG